MLGRELKGVEGHRVKSLIFKRVSVCMGVGQGGTYLSQRTALWTLFSPATFWKVRLEFRSSGSSASVFHAEPFQ